MRNCNSIFILSFVAFIFSCNHTENHDPSQKVEKREYQPLAYYPENLSIESLINNLNTSGSEIEGPAIGITGQPSTSYEYYKPLLDKASDSLFLQLTYHQNPKMRVYGMWGLGKKNPTLAVAQLERFFADTTSLTYHSGCLSFPLGIYNLATMEIDSH